jgi:hypothetical protein
MLETLHEEVLKIAPTSLSALKIGRGAIKGEIWPGYNAEYKREYLKVFQKWRDANTLVSRVASGQVTFEGEVTAFLSGAFGQGSDRLVALERCLGPISSTVSPQEQMLKYGAIGFLLGGIGGWAFGMKMTYEDPDLQIANPVISRRTYLKAMIIGCAGLFGFGGAAFGYFGSRKGQENYREIAAYLDRLWGEVS